MKTKIKIVTMVLALAGFWTAVANAAPAAPKMVPVAKCNDGQTMNGTNPAEHRGACSGHGGVASWADGSPVKSHAKRSSYSK